jgi:hypothetical protein
MLYPISPPTIDPVASPPQRATCPVASFFNIAVGVAHPTKNVAAETTHVALNNLFTIGHSWGGEGDFYKAQA